MNWIVSKEKDGKIHLISASNVDGMLPKGSFLTVEEGESKFILRVEDSLQHDTFSPSPMIIDMDLNPLEQDRSCKNILVAYRVFDYSTRNDGLIDYIKPQSKARLSNQVEIDLALGNHGKGIPVFAATVQYNRNQILKDDSGNFITLQLPDDIFYHQMFLCGRTGSGKTVAAKYLAQYFVEKMDGAVLAINVKDVDLLRMDQPSKVTNLDVEKEWKQVNENARGVLNFAVYYPANTRFKENQGVTQKLAKPISLDVRDLEPDALTGLLQNISSVGAMSFPNIFRHWQESCRTGNTKEFTFSAFANYFNKGAEDRYFFPTLNSRGDPSEVTLHAGTFNNIARNLDHAVEFFDNENATFITEEDILQNGKLSVIDVANRNGKQFGSIVLRHLLRRIVDAKREKRSDVPVLIIIDEVHSFYNMEASAEALGDIDTICRTGRSQQIGVILASQNPQDMPHGLESVINTKIFFKSDSTRGKSMGLAISSQELEGLKKGYALGSIHDMPQVKVIKFPLAYAGVFEGE
jgi:DNA helicase HerA-like ATPase